MERQAKSKREIQKTVSDLPQRKSAAAGTALVSQLTFFVGMQHASLLPGLGGEPFGL